MNCIFSVFGISTSLLNVEDIFLFCCDLDFHVKHSESPVIAFWFFADGHDGSELLPLSPLAPPLEEDPLVLVLQNEDGPDKTGERKNSEELQSLWRKAIHQQILLLRMEKENQKLEG